jgi:hypothetical protein
VVPVANTVTACIDLYEALVTGKMLQPISITKVQDGLYDIHVFPQQAKDKLMCADRKDYIRVKGEPNQVNPLTKPAGIIAVLGAGNYSSSLEMVKAMFLENCAVVHPQKPPGGAQPGHHRHGVRWSDPFKESVQVPQLANGITTDRRVTEAMVELVRELNPSGRVYIMECAGDGTTSENFRRMGYTHDNIPGVDKFIALGEDGKYRDVDSDDLVAVEVENRQYKKLPSFLKDRYYFDKTYYSADNRNLYVDSVTLARDWDAQPPELVWRQEIGAGWSGFSVVNGYAVTMEQRGASELVTCYRLETGAMVWAHSEETRFESVIGGDGPRATPLIENGRVYALGATGRLLALDGADGSLVWQRDLRQQVAVSAEEEAAVVSHGRCASPLIVGDLLLVPGGGPAG